MPSIEHNRENWDRAASWVNAGEEWSQAWGGTSSMWHGSILPRLRAFLPAESILEIACGHGRVSQYLLRQAERYVGVDLAASCVDACRQRFADVGDRARFEQVDGRSLACVADDSVDLAISWDSLVHADSEAVDGYLAELARVLTPGGVAFLHHSNLAGSADAEREDSTARGVHWRDPSVSAATVAATCERVGLHCRVQELVEWGSGGPNDCFTLLGRPAAGADDAAPTMRFEHPNMPAEMAHFAQLHALYDASGLAGD